MDTIQILLLIVLSLSTILLAVIGIQLFMLLMEARKTLRHINKIVNHFESIGVGLHQGVGEMVGFVNGFKLVLKALEIFSNKKNDGKSPFTFK